MYIFFSLLNNQKIEKNKYFQTSTTNTTKTNVQPTHLIIKEITGKYLLVIDSFNNFWDIYEKKTYLDIIKNEQSRQLYNDRYNTQKFLKEEKIVEKLNRVSFVICLTYSCNMRCPYCYQQNCLNLNKSVMKIDKLKEIYEYILKKIGVIRKENPAAIVIIELFGGEPIQEKNISVIENIFKFCRINKFYISITTNGLELNKIKKILYIYQGYIINISVTIDGIEKIHNQSRIPLKKGVNSFKKIINNLNLIVNNNYKINLCVNLGTKNIHSFKLLINFLEKNRYFEYENFDLCIGIIDNRFYNIDYEEYFDEADLLKEIINLKIKPKIFKKIQFKFLKTLNNPAKIFGKSGRQNEIGRDIGRYCWSTSQKDDVEYIDLDGNIFRCTYTVGRDEWKIGTLERYNNLLEKYFKHNIFELKECQECKIGGFCSGGCFLTKNSINREKQCFKELEIFEKFLNTIGIPQIKKICRELSNV